MVIKALQTTTDIYQLKVTLRATDPPVWRRLLAYADMTLAQLHSALQTTMGWEDRHMHQFRIGQRRFGPAEPGDAIIKSLRGESERTARLRAVLEMVGAEMIYTYDFGDGWEHRIVLEKLLAADPNMAYPSCTGGRLACPPEDCGGIPGYRDLVAAIQHPEDDSYEEIREWVGNDFDPEAFSIDEVNRLLCRRPRKSARSNPAL